MIRLTISIIAFTLVFYSCNSSADDFKLDKSGLKYKVLIESESNEIINIGDYVELDLKYMDADNDSVLFNSRELGDAFRMRIDEISHKGGSFEDALMLMNPGDSYQFLIPADSFYLKTKKEPLPKVIKSGSKLLFDIYLIRKVSPKEIEEERALLIEQMKEQEEILIQQFLIDNEIDEKPSKSGLYYIELEKGDGKKAKPGDSLVVHYNGKLIDGKLFDSSYQRNDPFTFKLAVGDVIQGWEEAFTGMRTGTKALLIIPSKLAYSNVGYSDLIPPYAPLIFEVELLAIKSN